MTENKLLNSAKSALISSAAFNIARDIVQFLTMIVLVRLISPDTYGEFALSMSIIGVIALFSSTTFSQYPLQSRDPNNFDWDAHFSAVVISHISCFVFSIFIGLSLIFIFQSISFQIGYAIIFLSTNFLIQIFGAFRSVFLVAHHRWARERTLLILGSITGSGIAIMLALLDFKLLALCLTPMLFYLPATVDFFIADDRKPKPSLFALMRYRRGVSFATNRATAGSATAISKLLESSVVSAALSLSSLGILNRGMGLSQLLTGRIGPLIIQSLFPVISRFPAGSPDFRNATNVILHLISWTTVPIAIVTAMFASLLVQLLYGPGWSEVSQLLPILAGTAALQGSAIAVNQIMLANLQNKDSLYLDLFFSIILCSCLYLVFYHGLKYYLISCFFVYSFRLIFNLYRATIGGAISKSSIRSAIISPVLIGLILMLMMRNSYALLEQQYALGDYTILSFLVTTTIFLLAFSIAITTAEKSAFRRIYELAMRR